MLKISEGVRHTLMLAAEVHLWSLAKDSLTGAADLVSVRDAIKAYDAVWKLGDGREVYEKQCRLALRLMVEEIGQE